MQIGFCHLTCMILHPNQSTENFWAILRQAKYFSFALLRLRFSCSSKRLWCLNIVIVTFLTTINLIISPYICLSHHHLPILPLSTLIASLLCYWACSLNDAFISCHRADIIHDETLLPALINEFWSVRTVHPLCLTQPAVRFSNRNCLGLGIVLL